MYSIPITFKNLTEVSLYDAYGQVGVYVLWHGRSQIKPLRIGQGQILHRFASHVRNKAYYWPIYGVVGLLGDETAKNMIDAKVIESALLHVSREINRFPTDNSNLGEVNSIRYLLNRYNNLLKVHVKGRDPFLRMSDLSNKPLYNTKTIEINMDELDDLFFIHQWHAR